ncbi:DUF6915 family protein [Palleronia pontilimi]|uniref:DUF6915 family protein n=1 Tax=Palleronia pontilimi TaxID=1964209 RepID=UPI001F1909E0|nr:hypothetical protein [Palleronia pontilimi]
MGHPYHHALSSARRFGGVPEDYIDLHAWFDESKSQTADFRHRALRHHAEGIFMLERFFDATITASTGRVVPVRLIGEQHVIEDLGFIPSFADWVRCIRPEPWMGRAQPIHRIVDPFAASDGRSTEPKVAQRQAIGGARSMADAASSGDDTAVTAFVKGDN